MMMRRFLGIAAAVSMLALATCTADMGSDSKVKLAATLSAASEVPPVNSTASGTASVALDKATKTLSWVVTYRGLTGPARAAHFHGPAPATANAGVVVPITVSDSPMQGSAQLNDSQVADLLAGRWYINVHTAAHQPGEIRGQVLVAK